MSFFFPLPALVQHVFQVVMEVTVPRSIHRRLLYELEGRLVTRAYPPSVQNSAIKMQSGFSSFAAQQMALMP